MSYGSWRIVLLLAKKVTEEINGEVELRLVISLNENILKNFIITSQI